MRFKEYLLNEESKHRSTIKFDHAVRLIEKHCTDAIPTLLEPIWRGFSGTEDAYLIQAEVSPRVSANTSNHYTIIMDHFLPEHGYPKRGASIICANHPNKESAEGFGEPYAIIPYDGVKIGVCEEYDLWRTAFKLGQARREKTIDNWNHFFDDCEIPDYSYEDLVAGLEEAIENENDEHHNLIVDIFGPRIANVEPVLKEAYSPRNLQLHLATTADMKKYNHTKREVWVGGKCVALSEAAWIQMLKNHGHDIINDEDNE